MKVAATTANKQNQSRAVANNVSKQKNNTRDDSGFVDNRPETKALKSLQMMINNSPRMAAQRQRASNINGGKAQVIKGPDTYVPNGPAESSKFIRLYAPSQAIQLTFDEEAFQKSTGINGAPDSVALAYKTYKEICADFKEYEAKKIFIRSNFIEDDIKNWMIRLGDLRRIADAASPTFNISKARKEPYKTGLFEMEKELEELKMRIQRISTPPKEERMAAHIRGTKVPWKGIEEIGDTPFISWLLGKQKEVEALNCWEAILHAAVHEGLTTKEKLLEKAAMEPDRITGAGTFDSETLCDEVLDYKGSVEVDTKGEVTNVSPGQILFFYGHAHVAMATDTNGGCVQLWQNYKRDTTIKECLLQLEGTMDVQQIRSEFYKQQNITEKEITEEMEEGLYAKEDPTDVVNYAIAQGFTKVRVGTPKWP